MYICTYVYIYVYMEVHTYICIHGTQRGIDPMYRAAPHILHNNHGYNICKYVYMYIYMYVNTQRGKGSAQRCDAGSSLAHDNLFRT